VPPLPELAELPPLPLETPPLPEPPPLPLETPPLPELPPAPEPPDEEQAPKLTIAPRVIAAQTRERLRTMVSILSKTSRVYLKARISRLNFLVQKCCHARDCGKSAIFAAISRGDRRKLQWS
jgi:hypothetical protein